MKKSLLIVGASIALSSLNLPSFAQCSPSTGNRTMSTNNVHMIVNSSSDLWWDFRKSYYEVPKGSNRSTTFSGGLWIGGRKANGQLGLAVTQYRQSGVDFWPGPIDNQGQATACTDFDRIWKVSKQEITDFKNNPSSIPSSIRDWPGKNNPNLPFAQGYDLAPFVDIDKDGTYDPLSGDYPLIKGDEAMYWVFNDVGNLHTESNSDPMGIEVHVMAYSFVTNDDVTNATFYDYKIINKSSDVFNETNLGFFTDFDLGGPADDFVGCDIASNMGYVYNSDPFDEDSRGVLGYGANPPMAAIKFVKTPTLKGKSYPLSAFRMMTGAPSNSPNQAAEYYNALKGINVDGKMAIDPSGQATPYQFSGAPGTGWSECSSGNAPGERKILMGFGEFDFAPGEVIEFSFANVYARGIDPDFNACTDGIGTLVKAATTVQNHYDAQVATVGLKPVIENRLEARVYPNPVVDQLTIELTDIKSNLYLELLDLSGRAVLTNSASQTDRLEVSLGSVPSGIYLLKLMDQDGSQSTQRLVVE